MIESSGRRELQLRQDRRVELKAAAGDIARDYGLREAQRLHHRIGVDVFRRTRPRSATRHPVPSRAVRREVAPAAGARADDQPLSERIGLAGRFTVQINVIVFALPQQRAPRRLCT
jgi:hypothetical protein